jgi:hypothetical protein
MNTANRIESSGARSKIHASSETAAFLQAAGKGEWLTKREDPIQAKGKGQLETYCYWIKFTANKKLLAYDAMSDVQSFADDDSVKSSPELESDALTNMVDLQDGKLDYDKKIERLQDWNLAVLSRLLRLIIARRLGREPEEEEGHGIFLTDEKPSSLDVTAFESNGGAVLDEVKDIIMLPKFDSSVFANPIVSNSIFLDPVVVSELQAFIAVVAENYRNNPFHNFEHASHVLMSVCKLLSRIVNPSEAAVKKVSGTARRTTATTTGKQKQKEKEEKDRGRNDDDGRRRTAPRLHLWNHIGSID